MCVGRALFRNAFEHTVAHEDERIWLRGVISPSDPAAALMEDSPFEADPQNLQVRRYSDDLMRAIQVEQSGTKGARLLIDRDLVNDGLSDELKIAVGEHRFLVPIRTLDYSLYPDIPPGAVEPFADVLWMVPFPIEHFDQWQERDREIGKLMRIAGRSGEEFMHVSATAQVFSEAAAMLGAVGVRRKGGLPGTPGNPY